ncbi:MAG: dUTP diphosphatase [Clostridia bacterium]|nr:dUTP diphosphatase [Clostridia bacterium]
MKVKLKKLNPNAQMPSYGSEFSAGADLCACIDSELVVESGQTVFVGTGLAMELPCGYVALIYARSGLACKRGLAPANKVGVIDSDYRGEIKVALHNHSSEPQTIVPNERIAQMVVTPYIKCDFEIADTLEDTVRGEGGFGSTGRN